MPTTPVYDVTSCIPSPPPAIIKQNGYNIWGVLSGSLYTFQTTLPAGKVTVVDISPCLSGLPVNTVFNIKIGDHTYTDDYYKDSTGTFKCGRPNDR